mmetsp:Transcript_24771/g.54382  ORF Transcript_24771/g.54382 Transcript_24771/m.54382 type:complete len:239 (+) Transcript_24771:2326-3042(+)
MSVRSCRPCCCCCCCCAVASPLASCFPFPSRFRTLVTTTSDVARSIAARRFPGPALGLAMPWVAVVVVASPLPLPLPSPLPSSSLIMSFPHRAEFWRAMICSLRRRFSLSSEDSRSFLMPNHPLLLLLAFAFASACFFFCRARSLADFLASFCLSSLRVFQAGVEPVVSWEASKSSSSMRLSSLLLLLLLFRLQQSISHQAHQFRTIEIIDFRAVLATHRHEFVFERRGYLLVRALVP